MHLNYQPIWLNFLFIFDCTVSKMWVPAGLPKQGFFVDHGDQYVRLRVSVPT